MKLTLISLWAVLALFSSIVGFADQPRSVIRKPIQIERLNLDYNDKVGKGDVEFLSYHVDSMSFSHTKLKASLEMTGPTLILTDGVTRFSIHQILDFVNRFDSIHAEDLNFYFENSMFHGVLSKGYVGLAGNHYLLTTLRAACGLPDRDVDMGDDTLKFIIAVCMERGNLKLDELTFPEESKLNQLVNSVVGEVDSDKSGIKIDRIRDFSLQFENHEFQVFAHVKRAIQWKVTMKGALHFESDKERYRLEVKEAHAGIFGVKKMILKAIQQLNDPNITVEDSNIFILYKAIKPPKPKSMKE